MALSEDGCLQQLSLKCRIDKKIKDIMSTMTSFGSVSIETSPPSVVIKTMKSKQAQIMSVIQPPSVKSINDIKLTLHNICLTKVVFLSSDNFIICRPFISSHHNNTPL
jgi:hypothetical protein